MYLKFQHVNRSNLVTEGESWFDYPARKLVRRQHLLTIISAWLITVPASAFLAATLFLVLISAFG